MRKETEQKENVLKQERRAEKKTKVRKERKLNSVSVHLRTKVCRPYWWRRKEQMKKKLKRIQGKERKREEKKRKRTSRREKPGRVGKRV